MPITPGAEPFSHDGGPVAVLLVHGFTGSPAALRPWAQYLADRGHTVRVPRLPGHGTRWQDMNLTTWEDWYAEVERTFRALRAGHDAVFVMGLSMGGTLTLRLAELQGDNIAGIVLVNPSVYTQRFERHLIPVMKRVLPGFPGIRNDIKKPDQDEVAYPKMPLRAFASLQELWSVVRADISSVNQPTLLLSSTEDHVVEPSNSDWVAEHIDATDLTRIPLADSYHVATLDNDAELIFASSEEFISRVLNASQG